MILDLLTAFVLIVGEVSSCISKCIYKFRDTTRWEMKRKISNAVDDNSLNVNLTERKSTTVYCQFTIEDITFGKNGNVILKNVTVQGRIIHKVPKSSFSYLKWMFPKIAFWLMPNMMGETKTELQATYDQVVLTTHGFKKLEDHIGAIDLNQLTELLQETEKEPMLSEQHSRKIIRFFIDSSDKRLCILKTREKSWSSEGLT